MDTGYISTVISAGFAVALAHAAIPTHWLPFVLAGRAQRWSRSRTLAIIAIAGGAHVVFTTMLGALIVWFGIEISEDVGEVFLTVAATALVGIGLYYIVRHLRGSGREHHHSLARLWEGHEHGHHHNHSVTPMTDRAAIGSLVAMLTFSPCESFLPVYLSGVPYGWKGFALLSVTLAVATLGSMMLLAWITSVGIERVRLGVLERHQNLVVGLLLCVLGIAVLTLEH
jgi:nickel/cobalt exporter